MLDISISNFKSRDVATSPTPLGKLTSFVFLINSLFHRTTFLNSTSKNVFIWFSGKTEVCWFPYFLLLTEFYSKYFCGCLRSHVIRFYLWMFHSTSFLITQEISIWYVFCNPRFLSNIYINEKHFLSQSYFLFYKISSMRFIFFW